MPFWMKTRVGPRKHVLDGGPSIYLEPHAQSLPFFAHVAYRRGSVLLWRGDEIPRGRGNFGGFYPTDNALYSIAFGTYTKTAEPIEMPFGLTTRASPGYHVLHWGTDPPRKGNFWGERSGPLYSNGTVYSALCKNGWTDRHAVLDEDSGGPMEPCIRWKSRSPRGRGNFWELYRHSRVLAIFAATIAAKGIIQSPITPCSRRGKPGKVQIVFWKLKGTGDAAYRPRTGWWDCTA